MGSTPRGASQPLRFRAREEDRRGLLERGCGELERLLIEEGVL
jgi:hypothetical protein